jgi:hypothetical protein
LVRRAARSTQHVVCNSVDGAVIRAAGDPIGEAHSILRRLLLANEGKAARESLTLIRLFERDL